MRCLMRNMAGHLLGMALLAAGAAGQAAEWPVKPVAIVVAGAPGGGTDAIARLIAADLGGRHGQSFIVDNRAGAGGIIGTKYVANAAADGHTLLMGHVATNAIVPALIKPRPYDPVADFVSIGAVGTAPELLVVSAMSGIKSLDELLAKARRGAASYGSPGVGLPQHLAGFALAKAAGVTMQHVPYRGSAPALADLIGGQITTMFVTPGAVVSHLQSGHLRALAVTSRERSRFFPDVPTMAELGYPSVQQTGWFGMFAPAGTPPAVVESLRQSLARAMQAPENRTKFEAMFLETDLDAATRDFPAFVRSEAIKWAEVVERLGVTVE